MIKTLTSAGFENVDIRNNLSPPVCAIVNGKAITSLIIKREQDVVLNAHSTDQLHLGHRRDGKRF